MHLEHQPKAVVVLAALILCGLLSLHINAPWQYMHDDNGAHYSSIARSHLVKGLSNTRGQDFFTDRETGALRPYLHHPPLLGLYLAGIFRLVGDDSPRVARLAMTLVHLASFFLFCASIRRLTRSHIVSTWCTLGFALVPMSSFFGKMPNHEPLSLAFVMLALYAFTRRMQTEKGAFWIAVSFGAWALAVMSAWHAAFVAFSLAIYAAFSRRRRDRAYAASTLAAIIFTLGLLGAQLVWANHGAPLSDQRNAVTRWVRGPEEGSTIDAIQFALSKPLDHGRRFFNVSWLLAVAYFVRPLLPFARKRTVDPLVAALCGGTLLYWMCFHHAVSIHAYQLFFLLPGVLLASGLFLEDVVDTVRSTSPKAAVAILPIAIVLTVSFSIARLHKLYSKPSPYVLRTTQSLSERSL